MFPMDARLVAGFLGIGIGVAGAIVHFIWGDWKNTLHLYGVGASWTLLIGSVAGFLGSDMVSRFIKKE